MKENEISFYMLIWSYFKIKTLFNQFHIKIQRLKRQAKFKQPQKQMLKNHRSIKCIHTKRFLFKSLVKLFIQTCSIASLSYHCFYIFMAGCLCSLKLLQYRQHKYASAIYSNNDHIEKVREDEERKQKSYFETQK